MKTGRILLETLGALAIAVLLFSFHGRIDRLRTRTDDVAALRAGLEVASRSEERSQRELEAVRAEVLGRVDDRLAALTRRFEQELAQELVELREASHETTSLRDELRDVERRTELVRAELARDVSRAFELVDSYKAELHAEARSASATAAANATHLAQLRRYVERDPRHLTKSLILPTVQLNGDDTVGSGTLVRSSADPRSDASGGAVANFVLTSYHVVRNIFSDTPSAKTEGVRVTIYGAADDGSDLELRADMVAHDARIDAALLELRSDRAFPFVADVLSREEAQCVRVWDEVFAIGCPLGNDPIPTRGELASLDNELGGANYWMINAPTYYGNSGGGVYLGQDRLALAGVFSKIYTHGRTSPVVVPHMGLCTPITEIYDWLDREQYGWVLDAPHAEAASDLADIAPAPGK